jgi:hypothetical protein
MSIQLMNECWNSDLPLGQKFVLLALCDRANDEGECYPSISTIATKCSMDERTVFRHIAALEEIGALSKIKRKGRSTIYTINPCHFVITDKLSPLTKTTVTPDKLSPTPDKLTGGRTDKLSPITINESSIEPSLNLKAKSESIFESELTLPDWLEKSEWDDFVKFRASIKKKMTNFAMRLMVKNLIKIASDHSPEIAMEQMHTSMRSGWADVYPPKAIPVTGLKTQSERTSKVLSELTRGLMGGNNANLLTN